jgi:hypothetical protein
VRDEYRKDFDPSRGGWGGIKEQGPRPMDEAYDEYQGTDTHSIPLASENQPSLGKRRRGSDDEDRLSATEFAEE